MTTNDLTSYRIHSTAGLDFGTFEGTSPAAALLSQHRDAGYDADVVWLVDDDLVFADDDARALLGDVDDWDIDETTE